MIYQPKFVKPKVGQKIIRRGKRYEITQLVQIGPSSAEMVPGNRCPRLWVIRELIPRETKRKGLVAWTIPQLNDIKLEHFKFMMLKYGETVQLAED